MSNVVNFYKSRRVIHMITSLDVVNITAPLLPTKSNQRAHIDIYTGDLAMSNEQAHTAAAQAANDTRIPHTVVCNGAAHYAVPYDTRHEYTIINSTFFPSIVCATAHMHVSHA